MASPNDDREIDRAARATGAGKSEWQERTAPAPGDPVSDDERKGLNVLGQSDPRGDGSIRGVDVFRVQDGKVAEKLSYVKG